MSNLKIKDIQTLETLSPDELNQVVGGGGCPGVRRRRRRRRRGKGDLIDLDPIDAFPPGTLQDPTFSDGIIIEAEFPSFEDEGIVFEVV